MTTTGPLVIGMLGGMSWESSAEYYRLAGLLPGQTPVPVFPTTRLHVEAAVDASLAPLERPVG